ncbi:BrpC [Agrobacterium tumefaciens]|nr:BrpC [Agrobacterium tumefaciens]
MQYQKCDPNAYNSFYDARELSFGNFVTADEVNGAFNQIQNEYHAYVNQTIAGANNAAKDAEQDARLLANDKSIAGVSDITIRRFEQTMESLGGNAKLNHDGTIAKPQYGINGKYDNVGAALDGISGDLNKMDGIVSSMLNGKEGIIKQEGGVPTGNILIGSETGGQSVSVTGTEGDRTLSGLRAGTNASDAVNVSQFGATVAALGGGAKLNADGTIQAPTYDVDGVGYNSVGDALKATTENAVQYSTDANGKRTNEVVLTGSGDGPVRIRNVAGGTADGDVANVRQVKDVAREARAYTDQRLVELQTQSTGQFSALSNQIERNLRETRGGIASAMGMAALRFDNNPGKLSIASGIGNFKGSTSLVAGLGYTSLDGLVRVNASVGYNFGEDDLSVNAGASFTLN